MKHILVVLGLAVLAALLLCCVGPVPGAQALGFATHVDYATNLLPSSVAVGDLNGDGKQDITVGDWNGACVSVLLGNGNGTFAAKADFTTGAGPNSVAIADFDGDGKKDLATANWGDGTVGVLVNTTAGGVLSFAAKQDFTTGTQSQSVVAGDFNGDGKPDLAVTSNNQNVVSVLLNTTTGGVLSFAAKQDFTTGLNPTGVAVGDFDHDGKPDLAVAAFGDDKVSVLLNTTTSGVLSFGAKTDFATATQPGSVAVGDFDGDGKQDLVATSNGDNVVSVLLGDGSGGFGAKTDFVTGSTPQSVTVADFNGDGKKDLAVANWTGDGVSVLLGNGSGGFAAKADFAAGTNPISIAAGDFDRDGKPDLVTGDRNSNQASVLRNTTAPRIGSLRPARGKAGATVTISGWGFGAARGTAKVFFGGKVATRYVSWSATRIKVKVPKMAKGSKSVTVKTSGGRSNAKTFRVI